MEFIKDTACELLIRIAQVILLLVIPLAIIWYFQIRRPVNKPPK
jgi:hypothetical protein